MVLLKSVLSAFIASFHLLCELTCDLDDDRKLVKFDIITIEAIERKKVNKFSEVNKWSFKSIISRWRHGFECLCIIVCS